MKSFKQLREDLTKGTYPTWVRVTVGVLSLRIRSLSKQIQKETDPIVQNKLIGHQNELLSYMNGLGVGVSSNDKRLLNRMKSLRKT